MLYFTAIRDPDGNIYLREYNGGLMGGGFEKWAKPAFEHGILPGRLNFALCNLFFVLEFIRSLFSQNEICF